MSENKDRIPSDVRTSSIASLINKFLTGKPIFYRKLTFQMPERIVKLKKGSTD